MAKAKAKKTLVKAEVFVKKGKAAPRTKDVQGLRAARAAIKMTKDQWDKFQGPAWDAKFPLPAYMAKPNKEGKGHTCYRDETFELATRIQANTKISYRPHAKSPGSATTPNKSHVRYEAYAGAKTAAESLKRGSWPADWCWDIERGFLQVHGPLREEPLDFSQVRNDAELTAVDLAVHQWYRRELAKKLGLNLNDLIVDKGSGESTLMRAHRLVAQQQAKEILKQRKVEDADVTKILTSWGFGKNGARVNVMEKGTTWVWSDNLGMTRDRCGSIHPTQATLKYPEVIQVINRWLSQRLPAEVKNFAWTSLNVNKDYAAKIHRDGNNFGPSMIAAFGDFQGGKLNYYPHDDGLGEPDKNLCKGAKQPEKLDIGKGLAMFNGNSSHSVDPFEGNRFSIVFFSMGCHARIEQQYRTKLREMDFVVPPPDADPHELLRAPLRKQKELKGVTAQRSKALPAWRFWPRSSLGKVSKRKA